ncbi:hypothetical protein CWI75_08670 [Kineobactrum sediminis]|uniref:Transcriptional regulator SutA RNAP-binding domain-containing protein n=1 Tax=Kineobactrum sediminis TaxID=1905677 RepID=A0A2N5Y2P9_9GAMM|nr:hypothetical protein [Kineobactrum sediminis]PLW82648.1 hypothetical protein CWI75_08670 [Kineobactrum sediminis]
MKAFYSPAELNQKERTRQEINAHVDAFLRNGGEISVISVQRRETPVRHGTPWNGHEDPSYLINQTT